MIVPTRKDVITALIRYDATYAVAADAERKLSHMLRAMHGEAGIRYGPRRIKPAQDGRVSWELMGTDESVDPELDMGDD